MEVGGVTIETCIRSEKKEQWRDVPLSYFRERSDQFFCIYLKSDHRHSHADRVKISRVRNQFYFLSLCLLFVPDKPS